MLRSDLAEEQHIQKLWAVAEVSRRPMENGHTVPAVDHLMYDGQFVVTLRVRLTPVNSRYSHSNLP
jgi:hypothetical protein